MTATGLLIHKKRFSAVKLKHNISGWLIMLPTVLLFVFFMWEPLVESIRLALYSTKGLQTVKFVGLANFRYVIEHPDFKPAVINTFSYTLWSLVIGFFVPIIIAMLLNEVVHLKGLFRVGTYIPNVVPGLATVMMWTFMFRSGNTGILNVILKGLGLHEMMWLSDPHLTIPLIVITLTWKGAGATALIYLAGLQGINPELYEAAAIDGAGVWKRIWHITVPNIYNLARTLLILQIISVFQIFYEPLMMTNGGPNDASISLMQLVYRFAFENIDYSRAAAVSVIISFMLVILTAIYYTLIRRKDM